MPSSLRAIMALLDVKLTQTDGAEGAPGVANLPSQRKSVSAGFASRGIAPPVSMSWLGLVCRHATADR